MKQTIYTKPLRMPDSIPTRTSDSIEVIKDDNGIITEIKEWKNEKFVPAQIAGGSELPEIPGEWLDNVEEHFFPSDPGSSSSIGYYITGIFKIDSDFINPFLSLGLGMDVLYAQIKDNIKNRLSEEFITALTDKSFPSNIILGSRNISFRDFVNTNCKEYFNGLGYDISPNGNIDITDGTFINQYVSAPILVELGSEFFMMYYTDIVRCLSQQYIFAEKDNEYYLIQLTLFD